MRLQSSEVCQYCAKDRHPFKSIKIDGTNLPLCDICQQPEDILAHKPLKPIQILSEEPFLNTHLIQTFTCGHSRMVAKEQALKSKEFSSLDGCKAAYEFQEEGIRFCEETGWNCLISDEMGLGKTIQALLAVRRRIESHLMGFIPEKTVTLIVIKQATLYQWIREYKQWCSNDDLGICPIVSSESPIIPGLFNTYIVSMDLIGRKGFWERLLPLKINLIVVDESHSFKDPEAKRSKALVKLVQALNIKHKIFLSGTPIKNRASEYFTVLNLLAPEHFPSYARFAARWLDADGKRIRQYALDDFRRLIARWVIRREKKQVLKNLPALTRAERGEIVADEWLRQSYNKELDLFGNFLNNDGNKIDSQNLLGWLARLRRITGKAKISPMLEYIEEFLDSTEDDKICIGVHHQDVRDSLYYSLKQKGYGVLKLSGEDSAESKDRIVQSFARPENRVLICNMLAGGIGLNLQMCSNAVIMEREWSAADEEQFIGRFHRNGQQNPVTVLYYYAVGTIDQWFHELVESKRKMFGETVEGWDFRSDNNSMRELAETVLMHRL